MTTAMMITSSPEDLHNLKITKEIISFTSRMFSESNLNHIDYNGFFITKEDVDRLDDYYSFMYKFLLNPGMTEEQFLAYEKEAEQD